MCLSMYDHPKELLDFLDRVTETWLDIWRVQFDRIPRVHGGYVNTFGIWAPGTVARTQCDASAFLSPRQYAEWYMPYDERICQAVDYACIHLHSGSLHTVEPLMSVDSLKAIQVSIDPVPASPPVRDLVPAMKRVLEGKPLIVTGPMTEDEAAMLEDELPGDGLCLQPQQGSW
jgi:hypothetical protein